MFKRLSITWTVVLITLSFITFQCRTALSAYQLEYAIEIHDDGSAYWIIEQKGIGIQPSFETFCQKVNLILEEAMVKTSRNMAAKGLSMVANLSGSYSIIRYMFLWENFSVVEDYGIKIGDVFEVENFFEGLYGNGGVRIKYPSEYTVESVSPNPHNQDLTIPMLEWYGIEDFRIGEPKIILIEKSSSGLLEIISKNWILIIILTALFISGGTIGFYYFWHHKIGLKKPMGSKVPEFGPPLEIVSEEEKVINLLRNAGGSMCQHRIAEECGFSRAKTSKLLKMMENKGKIKREQKGREKVV
ncbi:MAG: DUF7343 domain-containing protein, partial [Fervidobacterium sp.]